jgi:hypothetical protein
VTSNNGIVWTPRSAPLSNWRSVAFANNRFVAVASEGVYRAIMSADGISWSTSLPSSINSNIPNNINWQVVSFGGGVFRAIANNHSMISPDGMDWTLQSAPMIGNAMPEPVYRDKIQIGEYVFDKLPFGPIDHFEEKIKAIRWTGKFYRYIPFFIYKGDLYIEGNMPHFLGYHVSMNHDWIFILAHPSGQVTPRFGNLANFRLESLPNYKTTLKFQEDSSVVSLNTHFETSMWHNISQRLRNIGVGNPADFGVIQSISEITAGDTPEQIKANLHNFHPTMYGTGVFIVPPEFDATAGMTFVQYLDTLTPETLYTLAD